MVFVVALLRGVLSTKMSELTSYLPSPTSTSLPSFPSAPFHPPPPFPVSYLFYVTTLLRSTSYLSHSTSYPYLPPSTPFCNRFFVLVGMAFLADRRTTKKRAAQKNTLVHLMTTEMGGGGNAGAGSETLRTVRGCEILN